MPSILVMYVVVRKEGSVLDVNFTELHSMDSDYCHNVLSSHQGLACVHMSSGLLIEMFSSRCLLQPVSHTS